MEHESISTLKQNIEFSHSLQLNFFLPEKKNSKSKWEGVVSRKMDTEFELEETIMNCYFFSKWLLNNQEGIYYGQNLVNYGNAQIWFKYLWSLYY